MTLEQVESLTDEEIRRACALFRLLKAANAVEVASGLKSYEQAADYILGETNQPRTPQWDALLTRIRALGLCQ